MAKSLSIGEHKDKPMLSRIGYKTDAVLGFACAPLGSRFAYHGDVILLLERLSSGRCIWQHFILIATSKFELTIFFVLVVRY